MKKKLSKICKLLDTFGQPVSFYYSGRSRIRTNIGGLIRLVSIAIIGCYVYYILLPELEDDDTTDVDGIPKGTLNG